MSIGVPIKVLHEAEGHIITCETNTGEVYRGKLVEAEDNMNCQMTNITVTYRYSYQMPGFLCRFDGLTVIFLYLIEMEEWLSWRMFTFVDPRFDFSYCLTC